jgi:Secretion system C-terminal sorting domain
MKRHVLLFFALAIGVLPLLAGDIQFKLYPNPASSHVTMTFDHEINGEITIEVFSVIGNRVEKQVIQAHGEKTFTLNTSELPEGVYMLKVSDGKSSDVKRIRIQPV